MTLIEKKSRPESRQKKGGTEQEDGHASTDIGKKSNEMSHLIDDKEKRSGSKNETERKKSSHCLDRIKSAVLRKKSAAKLSEVTKAVALKKIAGKAKIDRASSTAVESKKSQYGKIWNEDLEKLALKKKRVSVIDKEIGLKYIRIIPPTPTTVNVAVRRQIDPSHRKVDVLVMKEASPDAELMERSHKGPRYDALGKIIPHSILGDVESFLQNSGERTRESNILLVHPSRTPEVGMCKEEGSVFCNPVLNEENALTTWKAEMEMRKQQQVRLAGLLKREEKNLLMCRSNSNLPAAKQVILNRRKSSDSRYDPNIVFWKIGDFFTARHLQETLPKSERGQLPTPVVSGDADSMMREKGKFLDTRSDINMRDEFYKEKVNPVQGTIHIVNKILFSELLVQGEKMVSRDLHTLTDSARGDHSRQNKGVKFSVDNKVIEESNGVPKSGRNVKVMVKNRQFPGWENEEESSGYDPTKRRGTVYQDLVMADQMSRVFKNKRGIFDLKFVGQEKEEHYGPAMLIHGMFYKWCCNGSDENCSCDPKGVKEVIVLVKGKEREIIRGFAKLENIGTTVIRYSWERVPEHRPLPVPRPRRRCFYFMDDDGIVLPRETVYVPMLFRSLVPGYFTESWLLSTQPLLEGGARVKFTFKAIAREVTDFSKQCQDIEDYLAKQQAQTLCSNELNALLNYAVIKASLECNQERYDPVILPVEEVFMHTNPGMYYHAHVIRRLQVLCESFIPETKLQKLENGHVLVSVPELWKAFLALPEDDGGDEGYINLTQKQTLMWQLCSDVAILCFRPMLVCQPSFTRKYSVIYSMLQTGIDSMVCYAQVLATKVGLVAKQEVKDVDCVQKQGKGNKNKGNRVSMKTPKGGKKEQNQENHSVSSPQALSPEHQDGLVFSAAYKYRAKKDEKYAPVLQQYDEKVYMKVYSILERTVQDISVLLEDL